MDYKKGEIYKIIETSPRLRPMTNGLLLVGYVTGVYHFNRKYSVYTSYQIEGQPVKSIMTCTEKQMHLCFPFLEPAGKIELEANKKKIKQSLDNVHPKSLEAMLKKEIKE